MPISLHAALIPSWVQILSSAKAWLDKASGSGIAEADLIEARLIEDMLPLSYQVMSMASHSQGAIEGVRKGIFSPDFNAPSAASLAELRQKLDDAVVFLASLTEEEMEKMIGKPMRFEIGSRRLDFVAENFLLSFSQPNFYFHAATAYDIIRMKGIDIGKRDYLGAIRITRA